MLTSCVVIVQIENCSRAVVKKTVDMNAIVIH